MLTGSQIRAARALLNWSGEDLAKKIGLARHTIMNLEKSDGVPPSRTQTLLDIKATFEAAGIEFIGTADDEPGVKDKRKSK
jgi:DNA-binding XRE family transcriptional regulator